VNPGVGDYAKTQNQQKNTLKNANGRQTTKNQLNEYKNRNIS